MKFTGGMYRCEVRAHVGFLLVVLLAFVAPSLSAAVTITYADLIDPSPVTHSGETVGEVLERLSSLSETEIKAVTQEIKSKRQELELAKQQGEISDEDYKEGLKILKDIELRTTEAVRGLKGLVEPFLETYAYVLDSFITSRSVNRRPPLIDVGDLFPAGTAQPAWAYLVRTRRYHVLTDGNGYVRMFIPGKTSVTAYNRHYAFVRHVLAFIYRSSGQKPLDIDVYAYSNDFASKAFKLDAVAHKVRIDSEPARPAGTLPLPLGGLKQFLHDGLTIEGASLSSAGKLSVLGTKKEVAPTLEGQPLTLADLAVAYRAVAYGGFNDVYISLDANPNPGFANVNFGGGLEDTRVGWVTLRADMRFKTMSDGFDPITGSDVSADLSQRVRGFATQEARWLRSRADVADEATRFWFYPDDIKATENDAGTLLRIVAPRYTPAAERTETWSHETLATHETPSWTIDTIKHLIDHYDEYAAIFPELRELDTVGRLLTLMTWVHKKNAGLAARLDLDELLDIELPACSTPRRRPQMFLTYYYSKGSGSAYAYNVSHVAETLFSRVDRMTGLRRALAAAVASRAIERAGTELLNRDHPNIVIADGDATSEGYTAYSVINGGLDLDVAKRMPQKGTMRATEAQVLQQVAASAGGEKIIVNETVWVRSKPDADTSRLPVTWKRSLSAKDISGDTRAAILNDQYTFSAEITGAEKTTWQTRGSITLTGDLQTQTIIESRPIAFARRHDGADAVRYSIKGDKTAYFIERLQPVAHAPHEQLQIIESAVRKGESASDVWKVLPADTPVVAVDTAADGRVAVLSGSSREYRLDFVRDGAVVQSVEGDAALREFESLSSARIRGAGDATRQFLYVTMDETSGEVTINCGVKRETTDLLGFQQTLDGVLNDAANAGVVDIIVYRDALDSRPRAYGGSLRALSRTDPLGLVAHINEASGRRLQAHLANDIDLAMANHRQLGTIQSRKNVTIVFAGAEANIETYGLNKRVRGVLESSGMPTATDFSAVGPSSSVILVWGNNNKALESYLLAAGKAGQLKGKVLLLATCFADSNASFFQTVLKEYGATAVMIHGEAVVPVALQRVLLEMPAILESAELSKQVIDPARLFPMAAEKVLKDPGISDQLRISIEKLLRSGLQISDVATHTGENTYA